MKQQAFGVSFSKPRSRETKLLQLATQAGSTHVIQVQTLFKNLFDFFGNSLVQKLQFQSEILTFWLAHTVTDKNYGCYKIAQYINIFLKWVGKKGRRAGVYRWMIILANSEGFQQSVSASAAEVLSSQLVLNCQLRIQNSPRK